MLAEEHKTNPLFMTFSLCGSRFLSIDEADKLTTFYYSLKKNVELVVEAMERT